MMGYFEMVKNAPNKSDAVMWNSVEHISNFLDQLDEKVPDMVRDFMIQEWVMMYGPHFNEASAKAEVEKMSHIATDGMKVVGEVITPDEAEKIIPEDLKESQYWDAYVGANGIAHDLARVVSDREEILRIAHEFWYGDDDFDNDEMEKIWWYYSSK